MADYKKEILNRMADIRIRYTVPAMHYPSGEMFDYWTVPEAKGLYERYQKLLTDAIRKEKYEKLLVSQIVIPK